MPEQRPQPSLEEQIDDAVCTLAWLQFAIRSNRPAAKRQRAEHLAQRLETVANMHALCVQQAHETSQEGADQCDES